MRTSHQQIRRRIQDQAMAIPDEELFGSPAFGAYLADIADAAGGHNKKIKVIANWEPESERLAATDHQSIYVNTGNSVSMSFPTRQLKADSLIGMAAHEIGHLRYTNFRIKNTYFNAMLRGGYYPKKPTRLDAHDEAALLELDALYANRTDEEAALQALSKLAHDLWNILEDAFIETRMCQDFSGSFKTGILLNRVRMTELAPSIQKQIDQGMEGYAIARNLILTYSTAGEINNLEGYTGEFLDVFLRCIPFIDDCIFDEDARSRCAAATRLILMLWDYIKPILEKARRDGPEQTMQELQAQFNPSSEEAEGTGSPGKIYLLPDPNSEETVGEGAPTPYNQYLPPDPSQRKGELSKIRQAVDYETGRIALVKTDSIDEGSGGGLIQNPYYAGAGYESCGSDIERLLNSMAEERVGRLLEQELTAELQAEADSIRYGDAHKGITVTVNRMREVPEELVREYRRVSPPLLLLSRRRQKQALQALKDEKRDGKLYGLPMGNRLEPKRLVREDGRPFSKRRLPMESAELAVALLVDESGSMNSKDRITTARAASIVLHDFCRKLDIPVMIMGHTVENHVELYSYADFKSADGKDAYRLMDMTARGCNRDGAALRYVAERLLKRPEKSKLLILISDGQPADDGYYGTEAEADLRGIRKEYKNKGITLFAAAIGDDKPVIERIYGSGFLDVTDLNKLPANLSKLIARYLPRTA